MYIQLHKAMHCRNLVIYYADSRHTSTLLNPRQKKCQTKPHDNSYLILLSKWSICEYESPFFEN